MKTLQILVLLISIFLSVLSTQAQISHGGSPLNIPVDTTSKTIEQLDINPMEIKKAESDSGQHYKSLKFAVTKNVSFTPENSGEWKTENEIKYWRLIIKSSGAKSLNLLLSPFRLEPNVSLFIYNPQKNDIIGAITHLNNKKSGILPIAPVKGDIIIIEMQMPKEQENYGTFRVSKVGHDYIGIIDGINKYGFENSEPCNVDINCKKEELYQRHKYSVCRIIIVDKSEVCSGILVNNARNDSTPYVLTANHCIENYSQAETSIFLFDFESPTCNGPRGSDKKTISGSELIAAKNSLDFCLVKLSATPPENYKPYYSGWSIREDNVDSTFGIHHPWGDVKKISIDSDPPTTSTFSSDIVPNSDWFISTWEEGLTEKGSSGSPLFNYQGQVIGTLTGGSKAGVCEYPGYDNYSKLSFQYNYFSDTLNQLKYWLNPDNIIPDSVGSLNGFYAFDPEKYKSEWFSNIPLNAEFGASKYTGGKGYISGHNAYKHKLFAEKFSGNGLFSFNTIQLYVDTVYNGSDSSYIIMKVWDGEDNPGKVVIEKQIELGAFEPNDLNIIQFDSVITVKDNYFIGYELEYYTKDTFVLKHTSVPLGKNNSFMVYENNKWKNITNITNTSDSLNLAIYIEKVEANTTDTSYAKHNLLHRLYPNPAQDYVMLYFPDYQTRNIRLNVYDLAGKLVLFENIPEFIREYRLDIQSLRTGIYIVQILNDNYLLMNHKLFKY